MALTMPLGFRVPSSAEHDDEKGLIPIRVETDAMAPVILPGDFALAEPPEEEPLRDGVYALPLRRGYAIFRVRVNAAGKGCVFSQDNREGRFEYGPDVPVPRALRVVALARLFE
jgi:hypothetical protein